MSSYLESPVCQKGGYYKFNNKLGHTSHFDLMQESNGEVMSRNTAVV